ncbi:proton pump-interactor BIP103-like [Hibiscus syriacus]|uniref:proton pump-interactor BIP103-like n=1 Tax=Hibiscus syriacus TaxID=106335 RepID=UPI0019239EF6|nr:proton pump-interactor BIP103-like [Hibiscus syriacus]
MLVLNKIPDVLRPERYEVMAEIKCLEDGLEALKKEDDELIKKFQALINRKSDLCDFVISARKEEDEANGYYNEYVSLIRNANELARRKDVKALEQLSSSQVDKFMRRWNDNQSFRTTYEKALLWSLHYRELSKDGRIKNEDEEPIIENGEIHKQFLHLISNYLTLFMVLDERNKMLR